MVHTHVHVGILGPLVGFDPSGPSEWGYLSSKAMVPTMPLFFRLGRSIFPDWKNTVFFNLLVVGNGGPLILVRSNVHVSEEYSIFGNAFCMTF